MRKAWKIKIYPFLCGNALKPVLMLFMFFPEFNLTSLQAV